MKWKSISAFLLSLSFIFGGITSVNADPLNDIETFSPIRTASSETVEISADDTGRVFFRTLNSGAWQESNLINTRNGISQLYFFDGVFVATSFFNIYTSVDGQNWDTHFAQVGRKFDNSNLIDDNDFYNKNTMSVSQIQSFLESKVNCQNSNCLAVFKESTRSIPASKYCDAYEGKSKETAAEIIFKVSSACNISAEVILATLEKEQALISSNAPSSSALSIAMGYACPDSGECDRSHYGFHRQVYNGTKQLQAYRIDSSEFNWFPVGVETSIPYQVRSVSGCYESRLTIKNHATAALYYYTPYQPNQSAIDNLFGKGDKCSAYGNRNFWRIYHLWLNQTKDYNVFIIKTGSSYQAIDSTGGRAESSDLKTWNKISDIKVPEGLEIKQIFNSQNGFYATTDKAETFLLSVDGSKWKVKNRVSFSTNKTFVMRSEKSHSILLEADTADINGKIEIKINDSEYKTVDINKENYSNNTITLPPFVLNNGTHHIDLKYISDDFFSEDIEIKFTVGTPKEIISHVMAKGDSLESVAEEYKVDISWLREANNLSLFDSVPIGRVIAVKYIYNMNSLTHNSLHTPFHTVMPGDTLKSISLQYSLTEDKIRSFNNLSSALHVGQQISLNSA